MLGADASESALKHERLTAYRRLHLAAHAVLDEEFPARSGIVLSAKDPGGEDGILRAGEIFNLEMDADLVVLSACKTGLGKTVRGEGMVGLTRAFLYAGARRVVVSLWEVNDLAVPDLMVEFYRGLREGLAPADALRRAKVSFLKSDTAGYRHPYYWAGFVVVGGR